MRKGLTNLPHIWSYALLHCKSFIDIKINKLSVTIAYNTAVFARNKKIDCKRTQHRRIYTVPTCRASASLHVTQDSCPCLDSCSCFNTFCHSLRMTDTLCIDNNVMFLTCLTAGNNIIDQFLLIIIIFSGIRTSSAPLAIPHHIAR